MQLLKSVVIGLGVLIFLGLGLLTYGFIQKATDPGWRLFSPAPGAAPAAAPAAAKPFGSLNLNLPKDCVIAAIRPDGGRLYLSIAAKDGRDAGNACDRVIVVDTGLGRVLGTIKARP